MDATLLLSLIGFAFVASITPGPNNLLLMSSGAIFGIRRTLPHLGGVLLGFATLLTASVFGLGTLVSQWPWLVTIVKVLGAAWLGWMSIRFFRAAMQPVRPDQDMEKAPISRPFRFFEAVAFQWVNPKAIVATVFSAGAYIAIADSAVLRAVILVSVFFVTGLIACTTWMMAGDVVKRFLSGRHAVAANIIMGILILATAIQIALS